MTKVRPTPCEACPYRQDVPSGLWAEDEYEKLRGYDLPTGQQPVAAFSCHATPQAYCHGWAVIHSRRGPPFELLALRLWPPDAGIPPEVVPLFSSGEEAADWGSRDINDLSPEAQLKIIRLMGKHPRLREEEYGH